MIFPPSITAVYPAPSATTAGEAPIAERSCGANQAPVPLMIAATTTPTPIIWTAAVAAPSLSFSPTRRATIAVAPADSPIATA